jgi:hypothetical protein
MAIMLLYNAQAERLLRILFQQINEYREPELHTRVRGAKPKQRIKLNKNIIERCGKRSSGLDVNMPLKSDRA